MSSFRNCNFLATYKTILYFVLLLLPFGVYAQIDKGDTYIINDIKVTGTQTYNANTVIAFTGLQIGEEIIIPGERLSDVTKKLWEQNLFSDITFYITDIKGNLIDLELHIVELPKIHDVEVIGIRKGKQKELIKDNELNRGTKITNNLLTNTINYIKEKQRDRGFFNTEVQIDSRPYTDTTGAEVARDLTINIDRGKRVKIASITFDGNEKFSDARLRRSMKNTKVRRFYRLFKRSKYTKDGFEEDKLSLIKHYAENGYRDARIIRDTMMILDEKSIALEIDIEEGDRYYFGDIRFVGNSVYNDQFLRQVLGIEKGDVYNGTILQERIQSQKDPDANDLTNLYQNNGYLFSNVNPVEVGVRNDTIDFEIRIYEGKEVYLENVTVEGNDRTNDHVIYRELRTRPGQKFRRSDIMRTIRELAQLQLFDAENIEPVIENPDPNSGTTDLKFKLKESGQSQIELQGGYGGGGFVGTLGLSFNNFSLRNIFNFDTYKPLPLGDGQKLSLRAQGSTYYQSYSLNIVEPWFGGKKPVQLSTSFSHTKQYYYDFYSRDVDRSRSFLITGGSIGLAKRLQWPDDHFVLSNAISFQHYSLSNYNTGLFTFGDGHANNLAYTIGISRDNTGTNPLYPTSGSEFSISAKLTPPYSLFSSKNFRALAEERADIEAQLAENPSNAQELSERRSIIDQERFDWLEYYKVKFRGSWYSGLTDKLVLRSRVEFGFLGAYNNDRGIPPFERFYLGGDGLATYSLDGREVVQLRGYPNHSLSIQDGSTIYNKYSVELRYPISLAHMATIYGLAFAEAGNAFNSFKKFNPFDVKRSAGVGLRIFMPQIGLLGIDFGYGFDNPLGTNERAGWETHFIIGHDL